MPFHQPGDHGPGLVLLRAIGVELGGRSLGARGMQVPRAGMATHDAVSEPDDARAGPVVAHQPHLTGPGVFGGETGQAVGPGAGEAVDGLLGITDHADVGAAIHPQRHQAVLDRGDVLVLVHHEVPVGVPDLLGDGGVFHQQRGRAQEDVVEIHHPGAGFVFLVCLHHLGHAFGFHPRDLTAAGEPGVAAGGNVAGLGPADFSDQVPHQVRVGVAEHPVRGPPHQREGVVQQRRELGTVGRGPEVAALAERSGVDGPGRDLAHPEPRQPRLQLACRPRCEGDREGRGRGVTPLPDGMGDPVSDRPRLPRPRPRQHHQRPVQQRRHPPLLGVKGVEDRVSHEDHSNRPHRQNLAGVPPLRFCRWRALM